MVQRALFYERAWDMRDGHCVPEKLDNIIVGLEVIGLWKASAKLCISDHLKQEIFAVHVL